MAFHFRQPRILLPGAYQLIEHPFNVLARGSYAMDAISVDSGEPRLFDYVTRSYIPVVGVGGGGSGIGLGGRHFRGKAAKWAYLAANAQLFFRTASAINITVCVIRRKVDVTLRDGALFASIAANTLQILCPLSNGTVYWDCGGGSEPGGRLSWAGYTPGTSVEYWLFHAGAGGRAIWLNGTKVASATAATDATQYTPHATDVVQLNQVNGAFGGDEQEIYQLHVAARQWTDAEAMSWFNDPWQMYGPIEHSTSAAAAVSPPPPPPPPLAGSRLQISDANVHVY